MKTLTTVCLFLLMAGVSPAIVVSDYSVATNAPAEFNWDYVYEFNKSSSVAVGSRWLLTAAHVADDQGNSTITVNGQTFSQIDEFYHSSADLALVQLDQDLPGYYLIYGGDYPVNPRRNRLEAILIGFGVTGTVIDQYNYTFGSSGKGIERWGYNKIDGQVNFVGGTGKTNSGLSMYFDTADTSNEAGVGTGDSGGGVFVSDNSVWKLSGIMTDVRTDLSQDVIYAVDVQDYLEWINSIIIETNDLDGDSIPNGWEQQFGSVTGVVATADQDGDGFTGKEEYFADTDPTDELSFFKIDSFVASPNQTFFFDGSTARQYQVFFATNDLADVGLTWDPAHSNLVWGTGSNSTITVTNSGDKTFYRLYVTGP